MGLEASLRVVRVARRWEEAVGPEVARHCRPLAFRNDTLEAGVESSAWCQQLQLCAPQILADLQRVLGDDAPSQLWFRVDSFRVG
jgi:predicted nucleic acid-binding Zn ribbon protein